MLEVAEFGEYLSIDDGIQCCENSDSCEDEIVARLMKGTARSEDVSDREEEAS